MLTSKQLRARLLTLTLGLLGSGRCLGQEMWLMYDSIPRHKPANLLVFHDYNRHAFFGYDECTQYIELKYGFVHQYHGRVARISWRVMKYGWLNRRWSKQMRRRNGRNWTEAYYRALDTCRKEAVFLRYIGGLPDTAFARIQRTRSRAELLQVSPPDYLRYLDTRGTMARVMPDDKILPLDVRRNIPFTISPADNWVKKQDLATLIKYIHSDSRLARPCLCRDTIVLAPPSTLGLEAVRLVELYRGRDYPGTRTTVSRAEVDELFRWWLEERKRP